jgi:hypothetical protein
VTRSERLGTCWFEADDARDQDLKKKKKRLQQKFRRIFLINVEMSSVVIATLGSVSI